eukprot:TRINITY_DN42_c1_g1_i1.p1 TRINITY_DN42_c1_g1~~TRINITY_DN42_c1_g1_i1.p1  ORF type:complete len:219 (+),score=51.45 TRINITY_DN42_c1_g1_i1:531-1187(+)
MELVIDQSVEPHDFVECCTLKLSTLLHTSVCRKACIDHVWWSLSLLSLPALRRLEWGSVCCARHESALEPFKPSARASITDDATSAAHGRRQVVCVQVVIDLDPDELVRTAAAAAARQRVLLPSSRRHMEAALLIHRRRRRAERCHCYRTARMRSPCNNFNVRHRCRAQGGDGGGGGCSGGGSSGGSGGGCGDDGGYIASGGGKHGSAAGTGVRSVER